MPVSFTVILGVTNFNALRIDSHPFLTGWMKPDDPGATSIASAFLHAPTTLASQRAILLPIEAVAGVLLQLQRIVESACHQKLCLLLLI